MNDELRALFVDDAPDGWLAMLEATMAYGVSRQTVMQRVKRGELRSRPRTHRPEKRPAYRGDPHPKTRSSSHDNQRKEQCDETSKHALMSASNTHS